MRWFKLILTLLILIISGYIDSTLIDAAKVAQGHIAAMQFQSSDNTFIVSQAGQRFFGSLHFPMWIAALLILALWYRDIRALFASLAVILLVGSFIPSQSQAYYSQSDYTEPYYILPNETAFWVPDVGDTKNNQQMKDDEDFYKANKVTSKLFTIPHSKLPGSGTFSNYYVPAGRLIIVERTPVARQWVDAVDRGTTAKKEGLVCQSSEGLDITVGLSIGVNIKPEDAPKYLYNFGISPPKGNQQDPNVIFTSVLFARTLSTVTDSVLKTRIHALICNELAQRGLEEDNKQAKQIMAKVDEEANKYAASVGITIEFLGWADTFSFDPTVQSALNEKFRLEKLRDVLDVQNRIAQNEAILKWNGNIPTVYGIFPSSWIDSIANWFHHNPTSTPNK